MGTRRYPRGSEWRKWDLHLHAPGTKLGDQYTLKDGKTDFEQFCQIIHDSDVAVVAIADYFSFDGYFSVVETYKRLYHDDGKLILPNLELRLPVAVNRDNQEVNLHLIFRPSLTRDEANKFLSRLNTEGTTGPTRTNVTCADLNTRQQFEGATVSIPSIEEAIKATFGSHAVHRTERVQHLLVVASAKGDGIRAGGSGIQRKKLLSDEIDKYADAIYANIGSRDYFLRTNRLESGDVIAAKPVFDGCDAHSFDQLKSGLGQQVTTDSCQRNITWIKADPTYAGLLQTLIEPAERVAMQAAKPDQKEPYRLISRVKFSGTNDFPAEVLFNPNLNAIIGSRSSGKSALLAFIAHAVDPNETVRLQMDVAGLNDAKDAGPAAGFTWDDVSGVTCEVEWKSGEDTSGKVIYIPQNSLYTLSEQPEEITKKIAPALFRAYPGIKTAYDSAMGKIAAANMEIKNAVDQWFLVADRADERSQQIRDLGDKAAITAERDRLQAEINRVKAATQLTDQEVAKYQGIAAQLDDKEARVKEIAAGLDQLSYYVSLPGGMDVAAILPQKVQATVTVRPSAVEIPESVSARVDEIKAEAAKNLIEAVEKALVDAVTKLDAERSSLRSEIALIKTGNAELIAKHEANEELSSVVSNHKKQNSILEDIAKRERSRDKLIKDQEVAVAKVVKGIADRNEALSVLEEAFNEGERILAGLKFGIEVDVPPSVVEHASVGFNQRHISTYVKHKGDSVSYEDAQSGPTKFLNELRSKKISLNKNYAPNSVAADVLTVTKEIRFFAELDSDRIGGFSRSSMTPGKQALFALTLILNESQEPWPLLIDQPEDDLDSRSIYDTIVPYLMERKKERQIIMASHNANLVIGADSEEVIVANRHGVDRPNKDSRTFEYLAGSLEHSQDRNDTGPTILGRSGIREHACEILDGGEEAFRKRREKYKL